MKSVPMIDILVHKLARTPTFLQMERISSEGRKSLLLKYQTVEISFCLITNSKNIFYLNIYLLCFSTHFSSKMPSIYICI